jgi:DNA polymerase-3 subunit chi
MTLIEFHFNTPERLQYTCKLLRKARRQGLRIAVVGAPTTLKALGSALWRFQDVSFLAHCTDQDPPQVQQASPIALGHDPHAWGIDEVLVNLGDEVPLDFGRFKRLVEVVANDDHGRAQARIRWKYYKHLGYELLQHDLSSLPPP